MLSVSLDSLDPEEHNRFRRHPRAYDGAIAALRMITRRKLPNVITSVRMTIRPHQISRMVEMVEFAYQLGCNRVSLSGVHPSGRAITQPGFWMTQDEKHWFIETIYELKRKYPKDLQVSTNDPLKCLLRGFSDVGGEGEVVFDSCPAAAVTFNVNANGDMTPCALMNLPLMNVFGLTINEIAERYRTSDVVKNMLDMNLSGKCGGCRARAMIRRGHYLAEDPDCWL